MVVLLAMLGSLTWAALGGRSESSLRPQQFSGSMVLEDYRPLTVLDLASATVTVRLQGVDAEVGATAYRDVQAVPVSGGTMLVNRKDGTFNLLEPDDYVLDPRGGGVGLGPLAGLEGAAGYASGPDAYIVRQAPTSTVSLVGADAVRSAARSGKPGVKVALGFATLPGSVSTRPGAAAVSGASLWTLVSVPTGCSLERVSPNPQAIEGLGEDSVSHHSAACSTSAIEVAGAAVGWAAPGEVRVFSGVEASGRERPAGPHVARLPVLHTVGFPATRSMTGFLPVSGVTSGLWFLGKAASGWSLFGVNAAGLPVGPYPLGELGPSSVPAVPAFSSGLLYTLDTASRGQPELLVIDTATGRAAPVAGAPYYPRRSPQEAAGFSDAEVRAAGPRVIFNNPESLEAVVVFTDGSRPPVEIDKSSAVFVSAAGPADLNVTPAHLTPRRGVSPAQAPALLPAARLLPVVQPVNPEVTCATTDQKPYRPVISDLTPSAGAVLVAWSYELLDQTDCEPDSWGVTVNAVDGPQPDQAVRLVDGQTQYLFGGLRPASSYRVTVTAYLNGGSTPSAPVFFRTGARGPDAPLTVTTVSDGEGDWVVTWKPCTVSERSTCVVPAERWTVAGEACGDSFMPQPPTVLVPGSATSVTISADQLGLLGQSASFSVFGATSSGLFGAPTSDRACTTAWRPPEAGAITLSASATVDETGSPSVTARLQVAASGASVEAFGSTQTEFVYSIGRFTIGPTTLASVVIPGLEAGEAYDPSVLVYPEGHPGASVTETAGPVVTTLPWPDDLSVSVDPSVDPDPNAGSLTLTFPGAPTTELLAEDGTIQCGGTGGSTVPASGPLIGGSLTVGPFDLDTIGGTCELTGITLSDPGSPDPYGSASPPLAASFDLGHQPAYALSSAWGADCEPDAAVCPADLVVAFQGSAPPAAGDDWTVSAEDPSDPSGPCEVSTGPSESTPFSDPGASPPYSVTLVLPGDCANPGNVEVAVSYRYLGTTTTLDLGSPSGVPPTPTPPVTTTVPSTTLPGSTSTSTTTTPTASTPTPSTTPTAGAAVPAVLPLLLAARKPRFGRPRPRLKRRRDERT